MSPRTIIGLAVLTVIIVAAAVVAAVNRPEATALRVVDEPAFPDLRARPDAVARVTIATANGTVTLERAAPDRWVTPERDGYPVAPDAIRDLVVQLADMRLIERKTALPERLARLEVQDIDAEDAKSRLVRLEDAEGTVLAEAIFGKRRERLTGAQPSGIYLRRPGENQSWLASGGVEIAAGVQDWLDPRIVDIPAGEIERVALRPANAEPYTVLRGAEDDAFTIEGLGEDETIGDPADLERIAGALAGLELADVRRVDELAWSTPPNGATFTTRDGLRVEVELALLGEGEDQEAWARFDPATGDLDGLEPERADEVQARAQEIEARVDGWAYRIPQRIFDRLSEPRAAWLGDGDGTS